MSNKHRNQRQKAIKAVVQPSPAVRKPVPDVKPQKPVKISIFKRFSKPFLWSLAVTLILVAGVGVFHYSQKDKIYAEIQLNDSVSFSFGTNQYYADSIDSRISPLCGCYLIRPHRGVQFYTKEFDLAVNDTAFQSPGSLNQFIFFSPSDDMGYNPSLKYSVRYLIVRHQSLYSVAKKIHFDSAIDTRDKPNVLKDSIFTKVENIALFTTSNTLNVMTSDTFATASLTPIKDAGISISKLRQPYNRDNYGFKIDEEYDTHGDQRGEWENPSVDVFGPEVKVMTASGTIKINGQILEGDSPHDVLLIFKVMPQLRILHNRAYVEYLKDLLIPNHAILYYPTHGHLLLTSSVMEDADYRELVARYHRHPIIKSPQAMIGAPYEVMSWRAPTITSCNGIAVYSKDLSSLESNETSGGINFGISSYWLYPQKDIRLKNLTDFKAYNEPLVIPLQDSCPDEIVKFHAKGEVWFDGTGRLNFNTIKNDAIYYLGFISSLVTIILFFKELKKWPEKK
ncbi:MAG: hypothetical protein ABIN91_04975 [Mucilaginibacter sp.]|uniref:hypothetical protein n=1 Tax=Mucilaginibacter sp. TaxID=1882438 RepID=UPI003265401A